MTLRTGTKRAPSQLWLAGLVVVAAALATGLPVVSPARGEDACPQGLKQRVTEAACAFLKSAVIVPHDSVSVGLDLPALPQAEGAVADYRFELLSSGSPAGTVALRITLLLRNGDAVPVAATARVRIYDRVCVATKRIDMHQIVADDDLRLERREVTSLADGYYSDLGKVVGKRTKRIVSMGGIVQGSDIQDVPLVLRGSGVVVSVVIGSVTVVSKAKALEDGDLGDVISVQHLLTGKRLTGTVTGRGVVVLQS